MAFLLLLLIVLSAAFPGNSEARTLRRNAKKMQMKNLTQFKGMEEARLGDLGFLCDLLCETVEDDSEYDSEYDWLEYPFEGTYICSQLCAFAAENHAKLSTTSTSRPTSRKPTTAKSSSRATTTKFLTTLKSKPATSPKPTSKATTMSFTTNQQTAVLPSEETSSASSSPSMQNGVEEDNSETTPVAPDNVTANNDVIEDTADLVVSNLETTTLNSMERDLILDSSSLEADDLESLGESRVKPTRPPAPDFSPSTLSKQLNQF